MDGTMKLTLLSFKKRENKPNYEPKATRFYGKLCQRCNTLCSDRTAFKEHQLVCVADDGQQDIEAEQSIIRGTGRTLCNMPTLSQIEANNDSEIYQNTEHQSECEVIEVNIDSEIYQNTEHQNKCEMIEVSNDIEIYQNTEQKNECEMAEVTHTEICQDTEYQIKCEMIEVNHNENQEDTEHQIKCGMCPERFYSLQKCKDHMKKVHLGCSVKAKRRHRTEPSSNLICSVCGKKFLLKKLAEDHLRVHTGEKPYQCNQCGKTFRVDEGLKIHLRTHTGERPYKCKLCPKFFVSRSNLHRHRTVHTGERPFQCTYCVKAFSQKITLTQHVTTVHYKQPWKYISKARRLRKMERESARETFMKDCSCKHENYDDYDSDTMNMFLPTN